LNDENKMLNTHYFTFILRLRLDDRPNSKASGEALSGSLQEAGRQEIRYFDSLEKLQQTLGQLVDSVTLKEFNDGKSE
jgi:hypothetical protein